jgi:hypothetical protein
MAAAAGFELATFRFEAERSIRLSYAAVLLAALPPLTGVGQGGWI